MPKSKAEEVTVYRVAERYDDGDPRLYAIPAKRTEKVLLLARRSIAFGHSARIYLPDEDVHYSKEEAIAAWREETGRGSAPPGRRLQSARGSSASTRFH